MRLALVLVISAIPVLAVAAEDRYGAGVEAPALSSQSGAQPAAHSVYTGRFLQWAGKTAPAAQPQPVALPPPPLRPLASLPPTPPRRPRFAPPLPRPSTGWAPAPMAMVAPSAPLAVTSPPPQPTFRATPERAATTAAPASFAPLPPSSHTAAPLPEPPAANLAMAAAQPASHSDWVHSRFYSLHRDYGDTPDPVVLPVNRPPVLIGPGPGDDGGVAGDASNGDEKPGNSKRSSDSDGVY